MIEKELHLIILWEKGRVKQNEILQDIQKHFKIVKQYEVTWTKNHVANNFTRFYGMNLPTNSFKEIECGTGPFLLIIVCDEKPVYGLRQTSRGKEEVNTNMFDAKMRYREWTGGGHKIHATNNPKETNHDLTLLLGENYETFLAKHNIPDQGVESIKRDIIGSEGWESLHQLFYVLNNTIDYVILRGKSEIVNNYFPDNHRDVDLLLTRANYLSAKFIINGESACSCERPHELIYIDDNEYYIDMWQLERYYFDWEWSCEMLNSRVFSDNLYVLSSYHDFYALLYHCLIFKNAIAPDYNLILQKYRHELNIIESDWYQILIDFIKSHNYDIPIPTDKSVCIYSDNKLNDLINKYGLLIKYLHSSEEDCISFKSTVYKQRKSFVKVGTPFLIDNEINFLRELSSYGFFPKVLRTEEEGQEHLIETSCAKGDKLLDFFSEPQNRKMTLLYEYVNQMVTILSIFANHHVLHRDLTPSNLIVLKKGDNSCKLSVIDFGWMIKKENLGISYTPKGLGNEYTPKDGFSDTFSFLIILQKLSVPQTPYLENVKSMLNTLFEIEQKNILSGEIQDKWKELRQLRPHIEDYLVSASGWKNGKIPFKVYIKHYLTSEKGHALLAKNINKLYNSLLPKFIKHAISKTLIYYLIWRSKMFDKEWYMEHYPEVKNYKKGPLSHFLKVGGQKGYNPSSRFSSSLYLESHPEVVERGMNPLVHYLKKEKKKRIHE